MKSFLTIACLSLSLLLLCVLPASATHNRAGEITFRYISGFTYEVTLTTYTDYRSSSADRPVITLLWGHLDPKTHSIAQSDIARSVIETLTVAAFIQKNVYVTQHTFPGQGNYLVQFTDPNRVDSIINIAGSVTVPFYVEALLEINQTIGKNQSPVLTYPPIDLACVGQVFFHNPGAHDADGDSLSFSLDTPKRAPNTVVPGYFQPPAKNSFVLDRYTGQLTWDYPQTAGIFNIAIRIEEYRRIWNGQSFVPKLIGYIIRDMQIIVRNCNNHPPVIAQLRDTCVEAGTGFHLRIRVRATDPDPGDDITLSATGGPFIVPYKPATFTTADSIDKVSSIFDWEIDCQHIREQPYEAVFRAVDNHPGKPGLFTPLADIKYMRITVVGPAPRNLTATPFGSSINLKWLMPVCSNAIGFYVYRKMEPSGWNHGYCERGVPASTGFVKVASIFDPNTLSYTDNGDGSGLSPGVTYCYRVTAIYQNTGQYQEVEGYASNEDCAKLKKDVPVIMHVSVLQTGPNNGKILLDWSSPNELDTIANPGPYILKFQRGPAGGTLTQFQQRSYPSYHLLSLDTFMIDTLLNTAGVQYNYRLAFYNKPASQSAEVFIGNSAPATSVFLKIYRGHHKMTLKWVYKVPWRNYSYVVYRQHNLPTPGWDSLATVTLPVYTDSGLENGKTFCYRIKTTGSYFTKGFIDTLINYSQIVCSSARDTIPPCPPMVSASADCEPRQNNVAWTLVDSCMKDVNRFRIYYSPLRTNNFTLVDSVMRANGTSYRDVRAVLRKSLAGCYKMTAVDTFDNESPFSEEACVDNCPKYELPNIFTPNGDEFNDLFGPMPDYRFVESIDLVVYNRWGEEVFRTSDPDINWDGKEMQQHQPLADGVYYYTCIVNEIYLDGIRSRTLKGTVHIVRK